MGVKNHIIIEKNRSVTVYFHIEKAVYGLTVEEDVKNETFSIDRLLTAIKETQEFDLLLGKVKPKPRSLSSEMVPFAALSRKKNRNYSY